MLAPLCDQRGAVVSSSRSPGALRVILHRGRWAPAFGGVLGGLVRLSDSGAAITADEDIAEGWKEAGIEATQIGGVWVFARWDLDRGRPLIGPLVSRWATELAR